MFWTCPVCGATGHGRGPHLFDFGPHSACSDHRCYRWYGNPYCRWLRLAGRTWVWKGPRARLWAWRNRAQFDNHGLRA